jgi:hypothetical protein
MFLKPEIQDFDQFFEYADIPDQKKFDGYALEIKKQSVNSMTPKSYSTISKINQIQNIIQISIKLQHSAGLRGVQGVQLYRARAAEGPGFKPNVT